MPRTLGVEEEFNLVDLKTRRLTARAPELLARLSEYLCRGTAALWRAARSGLESKLVDVHGPTSRAAHRCRRPADRGDSRTLAGRLARRRCRPDPAVRLPVRQRL